MRTQPKKEEAKQTTTASSSSLKAEVPPVVPTNQVGFSEMEVLDLVSFPFHALGTQKRIKVGEGGIESITRSDLGVVVHVAGKSPVTIPVSRIAWIQE